MLKTLAASVVVITSLAVAQDTDNTAEKRAGVVQDRTNKIIDVLRESTKKQGRFLQRLKKGSIDKNVDRIAVPVDERQRITFPSKDAKSKHIAHTEAEIAETNKRLKEYVSGSEFYYGVIEYPPKIGDFGTLYSGGSKVNVEQVIDDKTLLVNVFYSVEGYKVIGTIGNETVVSDSKSKRIVLMVKNVPTKGATDGAGFDLPQVFEVTDTETYETTLGGSNTVFVVEPLNTEAIEEHLKRIKSAPKNERKP